MSNYIRTLDGRMNSSKEKEVEYEDLTIWQVASDIEKQMLDAKYLDIFDEACKEYKYIKDNDGLRREKRQPLDYKTVWGIAAILNMLPPRENDGDGNIISDAIETYIDRVNKDDKRAYSDDPDKSPPVLTIVK